MKISIDVDCTPEEARRFLGLPDVAPMQAELLQEMQKRMMTGIAAMEPDQILKTWLPSGLKGLEDMQKAFWSQVSAASGASGAKKKP